MPSRREFLGRAAAVSAMAAVAAPALAAEPQHAAAVSATVSLCGEWAFQTDPEDIGHRDSWFAAAHSIAMLRKVQVPHTWQVEQELADYRGAAWYLRDFDVPAEWSASAVRIEFEAVFHSATVWVNGKPAGEHLRKGYTAFTLDLTPLLDFSRVNRVAVRVDNAFNDHMLPRGHSSDWAHDGGIYRPVQLLVTPKAFVESIIIDAAPDLATGVAKLDISAHCRNFAKAPWSGSATFRVIDDATGLTVLADLPTPKFTLAPGAEQELKLTTAFPNAKLWHFDSPNLYRLECTLGCDLSHGHAEHCADTTFGVRSFEIKDGAFHLNGEHVRLMGVERMAGSNPDFGMAEPTMWIEHDHRDLQHLNCVFTRVHWQQDRRVIDYCDRHGILIQTEVPTWGSDTFKGMEAEPDADIMQNGIDQLREMIARDGNHPSIFAWGLCNEIGGQNPPAYQFAKRMLQEAKSLNPTRLCSYASHSLQQTPGRDVAGLMDFIETNEYFGSWSAGGTKEVGAHLDELHRTFPGKPIVISEYGYCACTVERPEGDEHRIEIMRTHDEVIRARPFVGGAIFFCYNDYRTHIGDRGTGALRQRVHGVVDVYGAQKHSYAALRRESSPLASVAIRNEANAFHVAIATRADLPSYTLQGYKLSAVFYGQGAIPTERQQVDLPRLAPGEHAELNIKFATAETPIKVQFDILRPAQVSMHTTTWMP